MPLENPDQYWENGGSTGLVLRAILRSLQFIGAIVTTVLYSLDLHKANEKGAKANSSWYYAVFVGAASILVCAVHLFFVTFKFRWTLLDSVMFILWVALFGSMGSMFIGSEPINSIGFEPSRDRMIAAVWVDMVSMVLWFITTVMGIIRACARRRERKNAKLYSDNINMDWTRDGRSQQSMA
ncbi:hypothetical protein GQ53DRAFT_639719 [Thozetella sp. PMI_491]|nr:hypothetical protein GQ53DRAFT_639719 [Thozetella sp. PMI_491]